MAGPLVGGVLTASLGWRAVFIFTGTLTVVAIAAAIQLPRDAPADDRPIDVAGLLALAVCLTALVTLLIEGPRDGWLSGRSIVAATVSGGAAAAFARVEASQAAPMIPATVLKSRGFAAINLATILMTFGNFGFLLVSSISLHQDEHLSAGAAGLRLVPITTGVVIGAAVVHHLVERIGPARAARLGFVREELALVLFVVVGDTVPAVFLVPLLFLLGYLTGAQMAPVVALGIRVLPLRDAGQAAGIANTSRQVGAALGTGLLAALFTPGWPSLTLCNLMAAGGCIAAAALSGSRALEWGHSDY